MFSTRPLKNSFDKILRDEDDSSSSTTPEFDCTFLGPSKVFANPPKVGEKVQVCIFSTTNTGSTYINVRLSFCHFGQIEYDGFWYSARATTVYGDEIEYIDWDNLPMQAPNIITEAQYDSQEDVTDSSSFPFPEE